MLGFDAPQLFSLPPWAKAGIAMANIIAAMTKATTTTVMMRLTMRTLLCPKGETRVSLAALHNEATVSSLEC